ncbi:MAG: hypothetical protein KAR06_08400 [Deltaproteobacteria bacterium]|nr:hypothetical protein [Deltaproteobacteria bacterium]
MEKILIILLGISVAAFILNLPFGYLRTTRKKLSFLWFLYIHIPIPFIILLRFHLEVSYMFIPVILIGAIAGQFLGGRLNTNRVS